MCLISSPSPNTNFDSCLKNTNLNGNIINNIQNQIRYTTSTSISINYILNYESVNLYWLIYFNIRNNLKKITGKPYIL